MTAATTIQHCASAPLSGMDGPVSSFFGLNHLPVHRNGFVFGIAKRDSNRLHPASRFLP
jgi:hypothetical protein